MRSTFSLAASILVALIGQAFSAATVTTDNDGPKQCMTYTGANTDTATCNDIPDMICTKGCRDSFVVAQGCLPNDGSAAPTDLPGTQVCTVGFGRDTAAAKACLTESKGFSCKGDTTGYTYCYGCAKTRITYKVPPSSETYPPSWLNQSLTNPALPPRQ
ncbi:uncharacterized protein PGTG_13503 [Puccinia graminis f. sp. tritici CRL 75-36-700-3]|uniref:Secreted protein n=1 Tax=Puccinia graminis f. sp. tritici (strain CRL 75-36-700-3 / race SCCL) TaxID=418459 RepID=E3KTL0_PUCGT|nr:uncharacterized protein PGTG_13503 [Puccinia graminis f. sp. tritici CRL 75-36-700-3]EFP87717.2 hypothetical protein PGTG_13503 [Puccinia graminis f. sp. tritici CRL 75-36-700-3]